MIATPKAQQKKVSVATIAAESVLRSPKVVSISIFKKYSTQALPDESSATIPDINTLTPWTKSCPDICLETSKNLSSRE